MSYVLWTEEADLELTYLYTETLLSVTELAKRLSRTERSIRHRISKLKINRLKKWTQEEIDKLVYFYPNTDISVKDLAASLSRSIEAVQAKALKLGLVRSTIISWSVEEEAVLKTLIENNTSFEDIGQRLGRTWKAIESRVSLLGFNKPNYKDPSQLYKLYLIECKDVDSTIFNKIGKTKDPVISGRFRNNNYKPVFIYKDSRVNIEYLEKFFLKELAQYKYIPKDINFTKAGHSGYTECFILPAYVKLTLQYGHLFKEGAFCDK